MKYIVHSRMLADLTPRSPRFAHHAYLARICRSASWVLAVIAYLGVLVAPTVTLSLAFQVLHAFKIQPPSVPYWFAAIAVLAFALCFLYRFGSAGYHSFRHGVIDLETTFGFIGFAFAVAFTVWILPAGWIRHA